MSDDRALVDTNVLVYSHYTDAEHHAASRGLLDRSQAGDIDLCVVPQVLIEFYSIVTNPKRVDSPRQPEEVLDEIDRILAMPGMTLLPLPADHFARVTALLRQSPVTGARVFDYQLVAAMLGNDVGRIYTYDRAHFDQFDGVTVLEP